MAAADPQTRMVSAAVAVLSARPLLDLGTGVLAGENGEGRVIGADVRLVLPGRCLSCFGGVAGWPLAPMESPGGAKDWRRNQDDVAAASRPSVSVS